MSPFLLHVNQVLPIKLLSKNLKHAGINVHLAMSDVIPLSRISSPEIVAVFVRMSKKTTSTVSWLRR